MLVTNSEFRFLSAEVVQKKPSFGGRIARAFGKGLSKMAVAGERQANNPLYSIELAECVAQCMGMKHLVVVKTAGLA